MPPKISDIHYLDRKRGRISQGDIIRELNLSISSKTDSTEHQLTSSFSYGVVFSQECDLEQHYVNLNKNKQLSQQEGTPRYDKVIETVLICPAFPAEAFIKGEHIDQRPMFDFDGPTKQMKSLEKIKNNDSYSRFHYLPNLEGKFPELVIDFKRFYTIPIRIFDENLEKFLISSVGDLFRERISQRFTNYLGRIGLPDYTG